MRSLVIIFISFVLVSCTDPEKNPSLTSRGSLKINLEHIWGSAEESFSTNFELNKNLKFDEDGREISFESFEYQIDEILVRRASGAIWKKQNLSYTVSLKEGGNIEILLDSINSGEYDYIQFVISQLKFSGKKQYASNPINFQYDLKELENDRYHKSLFDQLLTANKNSSPTLHFKINVKEIWNDQFSFEGNENVDGNGSAASKAASNFESGWQLDHTQP